MRILGGVLVGLAIGCITTPGMILQSMAATFLMIIGIIILAREGYHEQ